MDCASQIYVAAAQRTGCYTSEAHCREMSAKLILCNGASLQWSEGPRGVAPAAPAEIDAYALYLVG
jgi:hypothetical protein